MGNRLAEARASLYSAVAPTFPEGRFHDVVPNQAVTPCGWIERPRLTTRTEGRSSTITVAIFSIVIAIDGDNEQQQRDLDDYVARVWDAADAAGLATATGANPLSIDIGGPQTTAIAIDVEIAIVARTLCAPQIAYPTPEPTEEVA